MSRRSWVPAVLAEHWPVWLALVCHALAALLLLRDVRGTYERKVVVSVGELQVVHADVRLQGTPVNGVRRLAAGDAVETGPDGRGRLRLDDGTSLVLDRDARVVLSPGSLSLERGRAMVAGVPASRTTVTLAGATILLAGSSVALEAGPAPRAYCVSGEIVVQKDGEHRVHGGETAALAARVTVAPEKAFLDWTGGMAAPWSADGKPRAAIGELWGKIANVADEAGSPLAIRAHEVDARIEGEVAVTRVASTYFNAGNGPVSGDFRMAIPPAGIVSRFATTQGEHTQEGRIGLATPNASSAPRLEWAGDGWVRGTTPMIAAGATLTVTVEYVEWLPHVKGRVTYRYPMLGDVASGAKAPLLGELRARIDATLAKPVALHVPEGATVHGAVVELARADVRPASDLVVELELSPGSLGPARAYVAQARADQGGPYVFFRTDLPPPSGAATGVTLAIVIDTSLSVDPAMLDAERGLVEALLAGLGPRDRVVVLAADQTTRAVGPATLGPVDDARRDATTRAMAALVPQGATDLAAALERAADALPDGAPEGMVLYVGDGWPTVGEVTMDRVRARLARREGGVPRLGAVAVGPLANRFGLTALVRGAGPILEIGDRKDAADAAIHLLADALRPSAAGVELDLGPNVERVYPRGARSVPLGGSVTAVGRLRGPMPTAITLRTRTGKSVTEERRTVFTGAMTAEHDVRRRWAAARVEELSLRGEGREPVVDAALSTSLLTPWTAWVIGSPTYAPSPLETRVLDLATMRGSPLVARLATPKAALGALTESPPDGPGAARDRSLEAAIESAARRALDDAMASVRACRDARAALRPELSGSLRVSVRIGGDGKPRKITVTATDASSDDAALDRCVEAVIAGMTFFDGGGTAEIVVVHVLPLPPPREVRGRTCSATSTLPVGARRGVWRERLRKDASPSAYLVAKAGCELLTAAERRAFLEVWLDLVPRGTSRVALARALATFGETEAADVVRREAIRRAETPQELWQIRVALLGDEQLALPAFRKKYGAAQTNEERLDVVRRFLRLAPHEGTLTRRLFALLATMGQKEQLVLEIRAARRDPFADAETLADGASALLALGEREEAARAFGELIERAPSDPHAHAYLGDRLRAEGLWAEASAVYERLEELAPADTTAPLRLALARAGAGRLDVASRLLARVAQTGGPRADDRMAELAAVTDGVLLAAARAGANEATRPVLLRRERDLPLPEASAFVLVRAPVLEKSVEVASLRGAKDDVETAADVAAPGLGLHVLRVETGEKRLKIRLRTPPALAPAKPVRVRVDVLVPSVGVVGKDVELAVDGKATDLRWTGDELL